MALEFVGDAISLSGLTGSNLKCEVIGEYYRFWWGITSGGPAMKHVFATAIVELDAATGEVYIKDTKRTVLGSAGHALELKVNNRAAKNLKLVLVEKDPSCYSHLKRVIGRRWNSVDLAMAEGLPRSNKSGIYLLNQSLDSALNVIRKLQLGNALFFFDPLRSVEYSVIEQVASRRIDSPYRTGTEFIVFVFTSDWFLGRDDFAALPTVPEESEWSSAQMKTVLEADALLGNKAWRSQILNNKPIHQREKDLIRLYTESLHKWFRYVLPLPFNPKAEQFFHLILCSNYAAGVRQTRNFYSEKTSNPKYSPDNSAAYKRFRNCHPEVLVGLSGAKRPSCWLILWKTIRDHEEGICDCWCNDFEEVEADFERRQELLYWLEEHEYIDEFHIDNPWGSYVKQYRLNWAVLKDSLGICPPADLEPLSPKETV